MFLPNDILSVLMASVIVFIISFSRKYIMPEDNVLIKRGSVQETMFELPIKVLVWNIAKGKKKNFARDFDTLSTEKDLVLIQEYCQTENIEQVLLRHDSMQYNIATSFIYKKDNIPTGVATGSIASSVNLFPQITQDREPWIKTPKTTLFTEYKIVNFDRKLLVINIHGLNRAGFAAFKKQLNDIKREIEKHNGPILLGGDFNTNKKKKRKFLLRLTQELELKEVNFSNDTRKRSRISRIPLDYIFTRGLKITNPEVKGELKGSDHKALTLNVELEN